MYKYYCACPCREQLIALYMCVQVHCVHASNSQLGHLRSFTLLPNQIFVQHVTRQITKHWCQLSNEFCVCTTRLSHCKARSNTLRYNRLCPQNKGRQRKKKKVSTDNKHFDDSPPHTLSQSHLKLARHHVSLTFFQQKNPT